MNTMNTKRLGHAGRVGRWFGRAWRGYLDWGQSGVNWLAARGIPVGVALALLWIVKLAVLVMLLYVVFWLALLLLFVIVVALAVPHVDWREPEPEWKNGSAGFGLYTHDGYRIDPHVHDDD